MCVSVFSYSITILLILLIAFIAFVLNNYVRRYYKRVRKYALI